MAGGSLLLLIDDIAAVLDDVSAMTDSPVEVCRDYWEAGQGCPAEDQEPPRSIFVSSITPRAPSSR